MWKVLIGAAVLVAIMYLLHRLGESVPPKEGG